MLSMEYFLVLIFSGLQGAGAGNAFRDDVVLLAQKGSPSIQSGRAIMRVDVLPSARVLYLFDG